jgi:hypothetical protein
MAPAITSTVVNRPAAQVFASAVTGDNLRDRIRSMIDEVTRAQVTTATGEPAESAQRWHELRSGGRAGAG